jgi:hypothetical protein
VLALTPIAIGIAITRYRLYEIDRLINRALVYGSLTAILAGVFTAAVSLAQRLFVSVTGERSDAAIVVTTLVVATLYAPLRKRLEALVDRQFKYERRRFGAYGDEIRRVIAVIDPAAAAQRLATETMRELGSTGTAVLDRAGQVVATSGVWPPNPPPAEIVEIEILGSGPGIGAIRIGPRARGEPYDPEALLAVREIAPLAASAVRPANAD